MMGKEWDISNIADSLYILPDFLLKISLFLNQIFLSNFFLEIFLKLSIILFLKIRLIYRQKR
ncbi:MAG: hypothetical protein BAJALOKI3v1_300003 [Promethearchaeota archaeon]|nr:MAG: hypothetical protein BAJALOKI3v1_300003 [Candidatus Lokiarchaeota archaeon]